MLTHRLSDEDLSAMYLSAKQINEPRGIQDHEELELLLESFAKQVEEIMGEVDTIAVSAFLVSLPLNRIRWSLIDVQ
jgi:hypothetical protein